MSRKVKANIRKRFENPEFRKEFHNLENHFIIIEAVISAKNRYHSTTEELSKITGIHLAELQDMENGTGDPTLDSLIKLAKCIDMKLELSFIPK